MNNQHTPMRLDSLHNSEAYGFHCILTSDSDEMHEIWIPSILEGIFYLSSDPMYRFVNITVKNGHWSAICKKPAYFCNVSLVQSCETPLSDEELLEIDFEDNRYYLYVRKLSKYQMQFHNYIVNSNLEISIGRLSSNDICYDNPHISAQHAVISRISGKWFIQDRNSKLGVFINGSRHHTATLQTGDIIDIMGLKIIVGPYNLSISDHICKVNTNEYFQQNSTVPFSGYSYYSQNNTSKPNIYFNRLPRKRINSTQESIAIEGPPMSIDQKQIPLMLRMGSSVVMGSAAALAGNFMTLISSVMFPFLSSKYTEKQRQEYEQLRLDKYREYLNNKKIEIEQACQEERKLSNQQYPHIQILTQIASQRSHLWVRRPIDNDFLKIRLGTGTQPLNTTIEYPARHFTLETDQLEDEMYALVEKKHLVNDIPIVLPLTDTSVCGLQGPKKQIIEYIRQLILQISVLHSYDEVKMLFFLSEDELEQLNPIRYLPHVWDDQQTIRFIATNEADAYKLGEYLKDHVSTTDNANQSIKQILTNRPYYIIFALNKKLFSCHEVMKDILASDDPCGVSIITAFDDLLKESQRIVTINQNHKNLLTNMHIDGGDDIPFCTDILNEPDFINAMRILANTKLKTAEHSQELPKTVTFLEMFHVGRVEQLNPIKRWQESNPVKSLAAPVGIGSDGSVFMLDLHEKRQGPHGLVAGTTGSGKSEFLITYILSMSINYHPDEVAFVLIDYKGGGLAGAFENPQTGVRLPHLAGTITNLDGSSIQRSLMSIESELIRRQKLFNEAKSFVNEGTMDIYTYQKLYREKRVSKPVPHLFIISDEFAELKQQQPEFMDKLISAARIGRSLGVHLILATQKPSGVVNDQIRSNTKFRVCLRVQDRSDSMDMLKRPEAAELTNTGRFFLQVGYNEYFAQGQSAWCGAAYEPQDTAIIQKDEAIEFLDNAGQTLAKAKPKIKKNDSGMKQIVAVVQYLAEITKQEKIEITQLCLPPLDSTIDVKDLAHFPSAPHKFNIYARIGLIDDPERQDKYPFDLQLSKFNHLLLSGNSGYGKSSFLSTLLFTLSKNYPPEVINFYILDFLGGALKPFQNAPHCGAYLTEETDTDILRFFRMIKEIAEIRKKQFALEGVTTFEAYTQAHQTPLLCVVIDNFAALSSIKQGSEIFTFFHEYLKLCAGLGIKFIISCTNLNELNIRSKQEIDYRITLQMKDKYAYSEALNQRVTILPSLHKGRGLCVKDGRVLEYQTAIPYCTESEQSRTALLTKHISSLRTAYSSSCIYPLVTINREERYEQFCNGIPSGRIPLGYDVTNIKKVSLPFAQLYRAALHFGNPISASSVFSNLIYAAQYNKMQVMIVKRSCASVFENIRIDASDEAKIQILTNSSDASTQLCQCLLQEIQQRKNVRNSYLISNNIALNEAQNAKIVKKFEPYLRQNTQPLLILFEDFFEFSSHLADGLFKIYKEIFAGGKGYNFYFFAGFYPETRDKVSVDLLSKAFIDNAFISLFGGHYDNQVLATLPLSAKKSFIKHAEFNDFLMQYNGEFYPMVMPCGIIEQIEPDIDEQPII